MNFQKTTLALGLAALTSASSLAQSWNQIGAAVETNNGSSTFSTPKISLVRGIPVVAYSGVVGSQGYTRVYQGPGQPWADIGVPGGASPAQDWWPTVRTAPSGKVYRSSYAYSIQPNGSGLNLRVYSPSGTWDPVLSAPISYGEAHMPDMEFDAQGRAVISYQDGPGGNGPTDPQGSLTVVRVDVDDPMVPPEYLGGVGFSDSLVPTGSSSDVWCTSTEIAPDGTIWVAWHERGVNGSDAAVARWNGTSWTLVGGFGLGHGARGSNVAMELDSQGVPYVATFNTVYPPSTGTPEVRVFKLNAAGSGWDIVGAGFGQADGPTLRNLTTNSLDYRQYIGLAISPNDEPYVAYTGANLGYKVCVRKFNSATNAWDAVGALGFSPGTGVNGDDDFFSLAFRSNIPFVTFRNAASANAQLVTYAFF